MNKCEFCVQSWYDDNGKLKTNLNCCNAVSCHEAINLMTSVLKEDYKTRNSQNINKNYNYRGNRK